MEKQNGMNNWPEGADVGTEETTIDELIEAFENLGDAAEYGAKVLDAYPPRHAKQRAKRKKDLHKRAVERRRKRKNGGHK